MQVYTHCDLILHKWQIKMPMNQEDQMFMSNEEIIKKRVAREILSMIETVCFSEEFREYRVNNGSNGTKNLIIENIKKTYSVG